MRIKNYMELAVKADVLRFKEDGGKRLNGCWCEVCEADVVALALTYLPPRYCMDHSYGLIGKKTLPGTVRSAVQKAASRVSLKPKHRPGRPDPFIRRLRLANYAFEEGCAIVRTVMTEVQSPCVCRQCQADTLAFALNRMPARYGVECNGQSNLPDIQKDFMRHELNMLLTQASKTVASRPHH